MQGGTAGSVFARDDLAHASRSVALELADFVLCAGHQAEVTKDYFLHIPTRDSVELLLERQWPGGGLECRSAAHWGAPVVQ